MRYLLTVGAAIAVTAALFLGMQHLISDPGGEVAEPPSGPTIDMVRVQRETAPVEKQRELPQKPEVIDEPPPPVVAAEAPSAPGPGLAVEGSIAAPKARLDLKPGAAVAASAVSDAAATPVVRVNPTMPRKATVEQIPGTVVVAFDIGPTGSTQDVRIVEETPPGFGFGLAARKAVKRWRYRAKIVDGEPVLQKGLRVKLRFEHEG